MQRCATTRAVLFTADDPWQAWQAVDKQPALHKGDALRMVTLGGRPVYHRPIRGHLLAENTLPTKILSQQRSRPRDYAQIAPDLPP